MKNIRNIIEQKYPPENPNDLWMKDDVLYKSTHKGWTPLTAGGGSSTNGVTSTTWQELKDKRDAGKLTPGALYRITDYNCTTTQENTQSAAHQFDIVLLALSENKLAEEGWAMMHDNIYDVTFADGVTKKCYLYQDGNGDYIVDCNTLVGSSAFMFGDDIAINENNNTATCLSASTSLDEENLPYSYFQNSNLSAWKVWYCLDNDKSRFAWADDSVDEGGPASITVHNNKAGDLVAIRNEEEDIENFYAWTNVDLGNFFTDTLTPTVEDNVYNQLGEISSSWSIASYTPAHEGTGLPNGRGVIYRLIDEWNNDCPYDFKNIVIYLGGKIEEGYLFSRDTGDIFSDMSLTGIINDITVKKTVDDNNCQAIDIGILITAIIGLCNIIVAGGALSENGINSLSSNTIFGYTIV